MQQLLGRFARTTAQRTATIVFAPQSSATQQHKHGEEVDVVVFHKIYAAHEKQVNIINCFSSSILILIYYTLLLNKNSFQ